MFDEDSVARKANVTIVRTMVARGIDGSDDEGKMTEITIPLLTDGEGNERKATSDRIERLTARGDSGGRDEMMQGRHVAGGGKVE